VALCSSSLRSSSFSHLAVAEVGLPAYVGVPFQSQMHGQSQQTALEHFRADWQNIDELACPEYFFRR